MKCERCGSYAINEHLHGRHVGFYPNLCDVCYWRESSEQLQLKVKRLGAEVERLKTIPMKYRRMEFNARLQSENEKLNARIAELEANQLKPGEVRAKRERCKCQYAPRMDRPADKQGSPNCKRCNGTGHFLVEVE